MSSSTSTQRYNDKQEAVLACASALFDERGVAGTTLSEIAEQVGLVKNSLTYYYRRKEDLALACFQRSFLAHNQLIDLAASSDTPQERITKLLSIEFEMHAEIGAGKRPAVLSFHEIRSLPVPLVDEAYREFNAMFRKLRELLRGPATASWSRARLNATTLVLMTMMLGVKPLVSRYEPEDYSKVCARLTDIVLQGLASDDSKWQATGKEMDWLSALHDDGLHDQFLRTTTALINIHGHAGASVNRIAEKMNLTKGGFYYYNTTKEELIAQCFERSITTLRQAVNLTEPHGGTAWEQVCAITRGLIRFQLSEYGPLLRSTAYTALPDAEQRAHVHAEFRRVTERIAGVIFDGLDDGSIRLVDPALAAHVLLSGIMAASEFLQWVKSATIDEAADLYAQPLLMGIVPIPE